MSKEKQDAIKKELSKFFSNSGYHTLNRYAGALSEQLMRVIVPIYRPLTKDSDVPVGWGTYFMVRPRGLHPGTGLKFTPSIVRLIDGKLYTAVNEIDPIVWSLNGEIQQGPTEDPYQANLEWLPIPE